MCRNIWKMFSVCLFCREEADKNEPFTKCQPVRSALSGSSFPRLLHTVKSLYKVQWPARCLEVIPWLCVTMETRVQKWNRSIMFSNTVHWEKGMAWRTNTEHSGEDSVHTCCSVVFTSSSGDIHSRVRAWRINVHHHKRLKVNKVQPV